MSTFLHLVGIPCLLFIFEIYKQISSAQSFCFFLSSCHHLLAYVYIIGYNKNIKKGDVTMANSLIQFRTEESSRIKASNICEKLGIDLPTYMRMCISRLIQENGIPFSMNLNDMSENKAIRAMKAASRIAEENGIANMTLDEINAEIADARK